MMKVRGVAAVAAGLAVLAQSLVGQTAQTKPTDTEQQRRVFALLDAFDPLDTSAYPFVRVSVGGARMLREESSGGPYRYGFLLGSKDGHFTVRLLGLDKVSLKSPLKRPPGSLPGRLGFQPVDMRTLAQAHAGRRSAQNRILAALGSTWPSGSFRPEPDSPVSPNGWLLLLARACARRGMHNEVQQIWRALPKSSRTVAGLADDLRTRLILDFEDPALSWRALLDRHNLWLRTFPSASLREWVTKRRDSLLRCVAMERGVNAKRQAQDQVRRAVLDLCNERFCDLFMDSLFSFGPGEPVPEDAQRPVGRLRALGLAAVPALIAAMDDNATFTRSLGFCSRTGYDIYPLGHLARAALSHIAGVTVDGLYSEADTTAWQAWYEEARRLGIQKAHAKRVHLNNRSGVAAALEYVSRWSNDLDLVLRILDTTRESKPDSAYRRRLVEHVAEVMSVRKALRLLQAELTAPHRHPPVRLAELLLRRGKKAGVAKILGFWNLSPQPMKFSADPFSTKEPARLRMLPFLVRCGELPAWRAIAKAMDSMVVRRKLLRVLEQMPRRDLLLHVDSAKREETEALVQSVLVGLLPDVAAFGRGATFGSSQHAPTMHAVSHADLAACCLAKFWPKRYSFDTAQTVSHRRQQIRRLRQGVAALDDQPNPARSPNQVTSVAIDPSAQKVPEWLRRRFLALQGKSVSAQGVVELLVRTGQVAHENGLAGRIDLERSGDSGVHLRAAFVARDGTHGDTDWAYDQQITVGGIPVTFGSWQASRDAKIALELFERTGNTEAIRQALRASGKGAEITLTLQHPTR